MHDKNCPHYECRHDKKFALFCSANPEMCICPASTTNYSQSSHYHCWDQESPACNINLANHTQCCLCDMPYSSTPESQVEEMHYDENGHLANADGTMKYDPDCTAPYCRSLAPQAKQEGETPSEGKHALDCARTGNGARYTQVKCTCRVSTPSSTEGKYTLEWLFGVYHGEKDSNRRQIIIKEANALLAQAREEEREKCDKRVEEAIADQFRNDVERMKDEYERGKKEARQEGYAKGIQEEAVNCHKHTKESRTKALKEAVDVIRKACNDLGCRQGMVCDNCKRIHISLTNLINEHD